MSSTAGRKSRHAEQDAAALLEQERAARLDAETAHERLRIALQAGGIGTWQWAVGTGEIAWSPGLEAIHGYEPGTFARTFDAFQNEIHPDDRTHVLQAIGEAIEGRRDHHIEYRIVRRDGTVRWVEGRGQLFCDAAGRPERMVGVCSDVTDRKQAAMAIEEALRARDEFLSIASHELRNPVNAVQIQLAGVLRALQRDREAPTPDWLADRIGQANAQVRRLERLLTNLLDVSRITAGSLDLEVEDVDLCSIVHTVVDQCRQELKERPITLRIPETAVGRWDPLRLEQIVTNLLSNAIKYGDGKPIEISLVNGDDAAHLSITDHGIGIDDDTQARLFMRFGRAVPGRHYGGFGLGLWITRRIVDAMGGQVSVDSAPGRGSTFSVVLPRRATPAAVPKSGTGVAN